MFSEKIHDCLNKLTDLNGKVCFLTGAGISAESGIRTFRGKDGYWTVGSDVYTPQEMATNMMFKKNPEECWRWYLMRFLICRKALPNDGHYAIANLETQLADRYSLITQNVDGLHLRAGSSMNKCFQIHGSINHMRCSVECTDSLFPLPEDCDKIYESEDFESVRDILKCPKCGAMSRPHVLWFDEYYNEVHYKYDSAILAANKSDLLIIAGTTLMTSLPATIVDYYLNSYKPIITIDIEEGNASMAADRSYGGGFIRGKSAEVLPELANLLVKGD
ncbi:MAG: hypothetical protein MK132_05050 [Lentisphaerales bacterium]|nr:hypothetical protein [Lentisphaerales bacterium]